MMSVATITSSSVKPRRFMAVVLRPGISMRGTPVMGSTRTIRRLPLRFRDLDADARRRAARQQDELARHIRIGLRQRR